MNDTLFIFLTIFITTALTYLMYKILLGVGKSQKEEDLQITPEELLTQLKILHKQKQHNIVQSMAKSYLEKKKNNDEIRRLLAKSYYESKKYYDAIDHAKIILDKNYNDLEIRIFLANCYNEVKRNQEAISMLQEVIEHDSDNIRAIKTLARIYAANHQKMSAIKMYKRLQEFLDNNHEQANNKTIIAELHIELNEYDSAIECYQDILNIYPDDLVAKKRLVELYRLVGDNYAFIDQATEIYKTAFSNEDVLWGMQQLLDFYLAEYDYTKALETAYLIKDNENSDKIKIGEVIAKIFVDTHREDEGIQVLKNLIASEPSNIELKKDLANAYIKKSDYETAISLYKIILDEADHYQANSVHIEISDLYANWAMHLFENGDNDGCFKRFVIALQYYNQNPDIYYKLANVNKFIKSYNEAISQYKKAIDLDPTNVEYYYAISECYQEIDSIYEQKKYLVESLKYNTDNQLVQYKLGTIYQIQGDLLSAISHTKKAVELDDSFVDAKIKLALLYENTGKTSEAISLYNEILEIEPENETVVNSLKMLTT